MAEDAVSITLKPVKTSLQPTDQLVCISNAASANGGNVSLIAISNLFGNSSWVPVGQSDPANSISWSGPSGVLFFSNTFGYISTANNTLRRFAISSF